MQAKYPYGIQGCFFSSQPMVEVRVDGIVEIPLAQTGEGIAECELLKWFVQPVSYCVSLVVLLPPIINL